MVCRRSSPEMGHAHHVDAFGGHRGEEPVAAVDHVEDSRHRHRAVAHQLGQLVAHGIATQECPQVDPNDDLGRATPASSGFTPCGGAHQLGQRIGGVGLG